MASNCPVCDGTGSGPGLFDSPWKVPLVGGLAFFHLRRCCLQRRNMLGAFKSPKHESDIGNIQKVTRNQTDPDSIRISSRADLSALRGSCEFWTAFRVFSRPLWTAGVSIYSNSSSGHLLPCDRSQQLLRSGKNSEFSEHSSSLELISGSSKE